VPSHAAILFGEQNKHLFEGLMKIQYVIGINGYTLLIYRSLARQYGYSIIDFSGISFDFDSIYATLEEATIEGRTAVNLACDFDRNLQ
jgi:hypothetical protein